MAEIFNQGSTDVFDVDCHIGTHGDIIIPINDGIFIALSALEAGALAKKLKESLKEYADDLLKELNLLEELNEDNERK